MVSLCGVYVCIFTSLIIELCWGDVRICRCMSSDKTCGLYRKCKRKSSGWNVITCPITWLDTYPEYGISGAQDQSVEQFCWWPVQSAWSWRASASCFAPHRQMYEVFYWTKIGVTMTFVIDFTQNSGKSWYIVIYRDKSW